MSLSQCHKWWRPSWSKHHSHVFRLVTENSASHMLQPAEKPPLHLRVTLCITFYRCVKAGRLTIIRVCASCGGEIEMDKAHACLSRVLSGLMWQWSHFVCVLATQPGVCSVVGQSPRWVGISDCTKSISWNIWWNPTNSSKILVKTCSGTNLLGSRGCL